MLPLLWQPYVSFFAKRQTPGKLLHRRKEPSPDFHTSASSVLRKGIGIRHPESAERLPRRKRASPGLHTWSFSVLRKKPARSFSLSATAFLEGIGLPRLGCSSRDIFMLARLISYSLKSEMKASAVTAAAPLVLPIPLASWHFPALASWPCKAAKPAASRLSAGILFDDISEPLKTFPEVKLLGSCQGGAVT